MIVPLQTHPWLVDHACTIANTSQLVDHGCTIAHTSLGSQSLLYHWAHFQGWSILIVPLCRPPRLVDPECTNVHTSQTGGSWVYQRTHIPGWSMLIAPVCTPPSMVDPVVFRTDRQVWPSGDWEAGVSEWWLIGRCDRVMTVFLLQYLTRSF